MRIAISKPFSFTIAAVVMALLMATASFEAESPCVECRKAALAKVQACMAKATTEAAKSECTKLGQKLTKECDDGVCKK